MKIGKKVICFVKTSLSQNVNFRTHLETALLLIVLIILQLVDFTVRKNFHSILDYSTIHRIRHFVSESEACLAYARWYTDITSIRLLSQYVFSRLGRGYIQKSADRGIWLARECQIDAQWPTFHRSTVLFSILGAFFHISYGYCRNRIVRISDLHFEPNRFSVVEYDNWRNLVARQSHRFEDSINLGEMKPAGKVCGRLYTGIRTFVFRSKT